MTYIPNKGIWSNITHVKFLSLRFCVKVSNFAPLKDMVRLISLDIYCTNISGEELCEFIPMGLIGINLGYCERLTSSKLLQEFLHQRCSLEMVGLSALNQAVNDEVLESLSCHDLKYLDISDCNNVTSVQVAKLLARQPNVEELSLQGTCHMAAILNVLASNRQSLENLRVLEIGGNVHTLNQENVDSALEVLLVCENLKVLSIFNCNLERNSRLL
ncbi:F-box/LRR-repeat protein 2-like [Pocillopora verrucosa]|uniref:F-box/LRR-repeat protein 2-like n=1 Tax=Pocillopora verrucosa TaxID=203993 RepID=UPI00333EF86A